MKKLLFGFGLVCAVSFAQAQNMLDRVFVEKHTLTADELTATGLTTGATTYRVFVDMKPGIKLIYVGGNANHQLKFKTNGTFFNDGDGVTIGNSEKPFNATSHTAANENNLSKFSSYITLGGVSKKTGTGATLTNARVGIPVTENAAGYVDGTAASVGLLGLDQTNDVDAGLLGGSIVATNNGMYQVLTGAVGAGASNSVLVGQFTTTDGSFEYSFLLQLSNGTLSEKYVAGGTVVTLTGNPSGEFVNATLQGAATPNVLPVVALTAPSTSTVFTPATITLSATASDAAASGFVNGGIGAIDSVVFFNGATRLGKGTLAAGTYSYDWTPAGSVVATITAVAYDNDGASVTSTQNPVVTVKAPNVVPTVTLAASATAVDLATAVTLTASPVDVDGTITKVEFFEGTTSLGSKTSAPWTQVISAVAAGAHTYTAVATDNDNAASAASAAVTVTATNALPTISISASAATIKVGATVTLTATSGDVDGNVTKVEFFEGATSLGTGSPLAISTLAVGSHTITAVATDNSTGTATSNAVTIVVNANQAPTASLVSSLASVNLATAITLTATAADADGSVASIEFFDGTTSLGAASLVATKTISALTAGTHSYTVKVTDNSNAATTSAAVSVDATNALPTIAAIVAPSQIKVGSTATLTVTAGDIDGSVSKIEFFNGSTSIGVGSPLVISTLPIGTLSITAVATDNSNGTVTSAAKTIVVNANQAPSVSLASSITALNAGNNITLTATAADVDGTISSIEYFEGTTSLGSGSASTKVVSSLTAGSHSYTAVATDNSGASTTSNAVVVVANALPTVAVVLTDSKGVAKTSFEDGEKVTITVNSDIEVGGKLTVYDNTATNILGTFTKQADGTLKALTVSGTGPYIFTWDAVAGVHKIAVVASNATGGSLTTISSAIASAPSTAVTSTDPNKVGGLGAPYTINLTKSVACNAGDVFDVPVVKTTDKLLSNCTGFDFVVNYDASKVVPTGVVTINNDLINHLNVGTTVDVKAGKVNVSVYLNGNGAVTEYFTGAGLVANVQFMKIAESFKAVDSVLFSATMVESYDLTTTPAKVLSGTFKTFRNTAFVGDLSFWADNSPIAGGAGHLPTNITYTKSGVDTIVNPNANGVFNVVNTMNTIKIARDINDSTDVMQVINGYDALLTAEVAVENSKFVPSVYQIIAMDVNRDGVVSAGDVSQINRRTVLSIGKFAQVDGLGKDWLFVNKADIATKPEFQISTLYPLADGIGYAKNTVPSVDSIFSLAAKVADTAFTCASTRESYVGILLGDANGNYKNVTQINAGANYSKLKSGVETAAVAATVVFEYAKATTTTIEGVNYLDVPVVVSTDLAVSSLDFALNYDAATLQYSSIVSTDASIKTLAHVGDDQTLRFTSYSLNGFTTGAKVVSVRFVIVAESLVSTGVSSTKAYVNGEPVASVVTSKSDNKLDASVLTASVYPNPATDVINVVVSQSSKVEVYNVLSQVVFTLEAAAANQIHVISTNGLAKGTYYVKVSNASSTLTKVISVQ